MTEEELDDLLLCEHTNGALQAYNYLSRKMSIERNQMLNKNPYEPDPEMHPHECEPDPELQFAQAARWHSGGPLRRTLRRNGRTRGTTRAGGGGRAG